MLGRKRGEGEGVEARVALVLQCGDDVSAGAAGMSWLLRGAASFILTSEKRTSISFSLAWSGSYPTLETELGLLTLFICPQHRVATA